MISIEELLKLDLPEVTESLPDLPRKTPAENDAWITREIHSLRARNPQRPSRSTPVAVPFTLD